METTESLQTFKNFIELQLYYIEHMEKVMDYYTHESKDLFIEILKYYKSICQQNIECVNHYSEEKQDEFEQTRFNGYTMSKVMKTVIELHMDKIEAAVIKSGIDFSSLLQKIASNETVKKSLEKELSKYMGLENKDDIPIH